MKRLFIFLLLLSAFLFGTSQSTFAQATDTLASDVVKLIVAKAEHESSCKMGMYHEHPNDICGKPATFHDIWFRLEDDAELYAITVGEFQILADRVGKEDDGSFRLQWKEYQPSDRLEQGFTACVPSTLDKQASFIHYRHHGKLVARPITWQHYFQPPPP